MGYSADSIRYLHIAYVLFIAVQIAYVAWLAAQWVRVSAALKADRNLNR